MKFICADGEIKAATDPVWMADNRAYRYGDGLFETMRLSKGGLPLAAFHFQRFFKSLVTLKLDRPSWLTQQKLVEDISKLCQRNNYREHARLRLSASSGDGTLYDGDRQLHYLIECWDLPALPRQLDEEGLVIGIYPEARKSCDIFSNLKSANFLPYAMAARYARENKLDDCLVLNTSGHIADATIANLFLIKDDILFTPALSQGCVAGVMRAYLLQQFSLPGSAFKVVEGILGEQQVQEADEIFLSNAVNGLRWVKRYGAKTYSNSMTQRIYKEIVLPGFNVDHT